MIDWLDDAVREEGSVLFSEHPESEHLMLLVEAPEELTPGRRQAVADHLRVCDACADDLVRLRLAALELAGKSTPAGSSVASFGERLANWLAPRFLVPVAALAVAFFAVVWPVEDVPRVMPVGRAVVLRAEVERGSAVVVAPDVDGRLTLSFILPGGPNGSPKRCRATIRDANDRVVAVISDIRAFDDFGTFVLAVDAGDLPAGTYLLVSHDTLGERRFAFDLRRNSDPK